MTAILKDINNGKRQFNIYVVEDSDIYRELLTSFVKTIDRNYLYEDDSRYNIKSFPSGEACIDNVHEKPDIIILDYYLDGYNNNPNAMNGMETLKWIKRVSPETHVVIVSTQADYSLRAEFIKNGASDYLSKEPGVRERLQGSIYKLVKIIEKQDDQAVS